MAKRIFRYTSILFISLFVFSINISSLKALEHSFTNYYGVTMTMDEYITLLNLGFSEDEIYYMTEEIFDENKALDATLLAQSQKYYKTVYPAYGNSYTVEVTEDEYYNHDNSFLSTVVTTYETINSSISANGSLYRYKVTMSWNNIPPVKSYDVIAIGFNGHVHINNSTSTFYHMYTNSSGNTTTSYTYYDKLNSSTGGTATYKVPSNFVGGSAIYYFNVAKDSGTGTINSLSMCGDYGHAHSNVTGNQAGSHSITIGGISFASSVSSNFDEIPCAPSNIGGLNW